MGTTPPRRWVSRRWPGISATGSSCRGHSWTIRPVCDPTPRAGCARGVRAMRHGAVVFRFRRRACALARVAARLGGWGMVDDLGATRFCRRRAGVGLAHAVRPLVRPSAGCGVAAFVGGLLVLLVPHDGPFAAPAPPFSWRAAPRILANRAVSLANLGYLGHMWELYAMWTWLAAFVGASELARTGGAAAGSRTPALVPFAVVGC